MRDKEVIDITYYKEKALRMALKMSDNTTLRINESKYHVYKNWDRVLLLSESYKALPDRVGNWRGMPYIELWRKNQHIS